MGLKERSWRDSTLSALDRIVEREGVDEEVGKEDGGEGSEKGGGVGGFKISPPLVGSFRHVDGAFVGEVMSPFGIGIRRAGWEEEGERIGTAV